MSTEVVRSSCSTQLNFSPMSLIIFVLFYELLSQLHNMVFYALGNLKCKYANTCIERLFYNQF